MKKSAFCLASCASIFTLCLAAPSSAWVKWSQWVDTNDLTCVDSETYPMTTPDGTVVQIDDRVADDWINTNSSPIESIQWMGEYTSYLPYEPGSVSPPQSGLPTGFILRLYTNFPLGQGLAMPRDLIEEVAVPMANVCCSFFKTVPNYDHYAHIFIYHVMLDRPWMAEKGAIYWLSVQATFDHDPDDNDEFCGWAWDSTTPGTRDGRELLDGGHASYNGGTWQYVRYGPPNQYTGMAIDFAFNLYSSPIEVSPATAPANTATNVSISATPPLVISFTGFLIVLMPDGEIISFVPASGKAPKKGAVTTISVPCGIKKGIVPLVSNFPALTEPIQADLFNNTVVMPAGTYVLKAGFFDSTKPITGEKDAYMLGTQTLVVQ